ncbi:MAG: DUF1016 N-terminal domain-containing protein [Bacteroidaceae bacterium]|nr:DUF1016 N-terminal domain-containing protein [Bacteroidaceae bacterium]
MKETNTPLAIPSPEYKQWLCDIAARFKQQQIKAAIHINSDKLEFYWSIGRDICEMHIEERWGEGVIKNLSKDIKRTLPDLTGLTPGGLYYCKRFYLLYNQMLKIVSQLGEIISVHQEFGVMNHKTIKVSSAVESCKDKDPR